MFLKGHRQANTLNYNRHLSLLFVIVQLLYGYEKFRSKPYSDTTIQHRTACSLQHFNQFAGYEEAIPGGS